MIIKFDKNNQKLIKLFFISLFISTSFIFLINSKSTATNWPANDNLPGVCRLLSSICLAEDFFTNASSGSTPRFPFIYLIAQFTHFLDQGIGGGLAIVKSILLIFFPVTVACLFITSIRLHIGINEKNKWETSTINLTIFAIAPLLIIPLQGRLSSFLTVAWWPPLTFDATAHNFSLFLSICGLLMIRNTVRQIKGIGILFVALGTIIHPVVGLFGVIFFCIVFWTEESTSRNRNLFLYSIGSSILGIILIEGIFHGSTSLSSKEFVRIYALEAHPFHYIPSQFGSMGKIPWLLSFLIVNFGLLAVSVILYRLKSPAWRNSSIFCIAYFLSVLIQFLFVELYPIKLIATIGPSRFTMFGLWAMLVFYSVAILKLIGNGKLIQKTTNLVDLFLSRIRFIHIFICYLILGVAIVSYIKKASLIDIPEDSVPLVDFAITKTKFNDVFVLPISASRTNFPLSSGRAVFFGNGFPFSEEYFREWEDRNAIVNGSNSEILKLPGSWIGEKYENHYRQLSPKDFVDASGKYKLNWVVTETDYSQKFLKCNAEFRSMKFNVYSITSLKNCI